MVINMLPLNKSYRSMKDYNKYAISYIGLADGMHEFDFVIDSAFLEAFDRADEFKGEIPVKVVLEKKSLGLKFEFSIEGEMNVPCHRCLEQMSLEIDGASELFVNFGETFEDLEYNLIVVPESNDEIDVTQYIYELFSLSMPIKMVHKDNEDGESTCNQDMILRLDEFSQEDAVDSRWDELKKLIDN